MIELHLIRTRIRLIAKLIVEMFHDKDSHADRGRGTISKSAISIEIDMAQTNPVPFVGSDSMIAGPAFAASLQFGLPIFCCSPMSKFPLLEVRPWVGGH